MAHSGSKRTAHLDGHIFEPHVRFVVKFPMVVTVNIPDELATQAKARGLSLESYVQEILTQQLAAHPVEARQSRTPEEIRAWLDSLAQFSDRIPPLPDTISREWIYQDHD